ncbi:hypothetical protein GIB67_004025 [Kingdonia uniflora]|uniref:Uncharacterized protein n=1 Tax=Kingdonia uniflora TaxID=39325 RepID=A0A7J7NRB1_9MAGN|nr:hypothetical protein GIB67_004025 [Kingdonia uniflora]
MIVKKGSHLEYTCEGDIEDKNKLANVLWVANYCEDRLRNIKLFRPIDVFTTIRRKFGIDLSYWTSWNAWTICMEKTVGSFDEGYFKMPSLTIELLTTNLGSIIGCSKDDATLQWTGTMVMFKASYDSWLRGCRPVLGLNGCFLKAKYGGVCLSIIRLDGNNVCILVWLRKASWKKYCSEYHWVSTYVKTYVSTIYSVADETIWVKPPMEFRPPSLLRPTGRPRKSRRKGEDELTNGSARRCGKCGHWAQ